MTDSKNISLGHFAKAHCANYSAGQGCYATEVVDVDKEPPEVQHGPCLVAQGEPCKYFRKAVLSASDCPDRVRRRYAEIDEAVETKSIRLCPECGAELGHRRRICDQCRKKRTRDRVRNHRHRTGQTCNALSRF